MLTYSRWTPDRSEPETVAHIRAHLSSIAAPDDDPDVYAGEVEISREDEAGGLLITGTLNREPAAEYLRDDWTPEQDIAANPLTVRSILEDET
jgi:hypothetical protein